ncbi:MAG: hypothetical protein HOE90_24195 [Bacteriovoracaceae bacterium]|nr:hypothetical protein [Bacteriovoracaceae bacterium]
MNFLGLVIILILSVAAHAGGPFNPSKEGEVTMEPQIAYGSVATSESYKNSTNSISQAVPTGLIIDSHYQNPEKLDNFQLVSRIQVFPVSTKRELEFPLDLWISGGVMVERFWQKNLLVLEGFYQRFGNLSLTGLNIPYIVDNSSFGISAGAMFESLYFKKRTHLNLNLDFIPAGSSSSSTGAGQDSYWGYGGRAKLNFYAWKNWPLSFFGSFHYYKKTYQLTRMSLGLSLGYRIQ